MYNILMAHGVEKKIMIKMKLERHDFRQDSRLHKVGAADITFSLPKWMSNFSVKSNRFPMLPENSIRRFLKLV